MASPGGWTYRVGLNLLRRHHRRVVLEKRALRRAQADQPEAVAATVQTELWEAVRALPPRERTMVALRYGADLTEVDIAQLLEVAPGTVSATLNHARTRLRAALSDPIDEVHDGRA
jgi:RNA polymerase sigma-70 factor (ECF subfamily)